MCRLFDSCALCEYAFIRCEQEVTYWRRLREAVDANTEVVDGDLQ